MEKERLVYKKEHKFCIYKDFRFEVRTLFENKLKGVKLEPLSGYINIQNEKHWFFKIDTFQTSYTDGFLSALNLLKQNGFKFTEQAQKEFDSLTKFKQEREEAYERFNQEQEELQRKQEELKKKQVEENQKITFEWQYCNEYDCRVNNQICSKCKRYDTAYCRPQKMVAHLTQEQYDEYVKQGII